MGQYKFSFVFKWQIGFLIQYTAGLSFVISIPFTDIIIGLTDGANGFGFWKEV